MRAMGLGSFLPDGLRQFLPGGFEVLVNYNVFELVRVVELFPRVLDAAADHRVRILTAAAHAPLQLRDRGRQDEDADAIRIKAPHLLRTLPVDLEDQVL